MRSTVSRVLGSAVVMTLAGAIGPGHATEQAMDAASAPAATLSPVVSQAPGAGDAALPAAPDTKMDLEQVRAAMAAAEKNRQALLAPSPQFSKELVEKWGTEVIGIKRTAGGYMLDFRFRVLDAEKALPLFDHRIKPYVVAEKSNIKLPVPMAAKVGAFRPTNRGKNIKADKTYYMIFANPDSHVKAGDTVSVVIGEFKAEHLAVN